MDFKFNKFTKNINFEENNTLNSFITVSYTHLTLPTTSRV